METPGGSGEMQFLGRGNEVFQMPEFHRTGAYVSAAVLLALVHQVSDWGSGAAAYFGWMREAKRENTRCGL
jgi:hypothetical protein